MNTVTVNKLTPTSRKTAGFALLMVLMLIATASVVGISYIYGAQVKTASTGNLMLASSARYLAESGLQHGLYALQTRATPFGSADAPNGPYHVEAGDGGYVFYIAATSDPRNYRIVATGEEGEISQTVAMTVRLTSQYAEKMNDLDPMYWWRLGDSGFAAVDEAEREDGTYVNGVTRGVSGAILGDPDTAADFRGSNDYVDISNVEKLDWPRVTFGCWARADAWSDAFPRLMARGESQSGLDRRWQVSVTHTRKLRFVLRLKNTNEICTGQTPLSLGEWFFVVATFDKDARKMVIYLNGRQDGVRNNTLGEDIKDDDDELDAWIGDHPTIAGQAQWYGPIDEAFILKDKAMTPDEVRELFEASIPSVKVISWDD
ncbi:MAG: hypothetical protein QGG42_01345 [Phycisphaerae bacterium]|jgi:hypothetical protein|nr:hypothetical protein [Phycisphaerae bacterium]